MTGGDLPLGPVVRPGVVRDDLDRHYTPLPLAREIVARLREAGCDPSGGAVLEPSVGGGSFVLAVRGSFIACTIGVDVDPGARGLDLCDYGHVADFPSWASAVVGAVFDRFHESASAVNPHTVDAVGRRLRLVVGNPPFSARGKADQLRTRLNIRAALDVADVADAWCALILPSAFVLGGEAWSWLDDEPACRPSHLWPITRRPWGDRVRETSVYVWCPRSERERDDWPGPRVGRRVIW